MHQTYMKYAKLGQWRAPIIITRSSDAKKRKKRWMRQQGYVVSTSHLLRMSSDATKAYFVSWLKLLLISTKQLFRRKLKSYCGSGTPKCVLNTLCDERHLNRPIYYCVRVFQFLKIATLLQSPWIILQLSCWLSLFNKNGVIFSCGDPTFIST